MSCSSMAHTPPEKQPCVHTVTPPPPPRARLSIYVPACRAPALHTSTPMSQKYIHKTCFTSCVASNEKPCPIATIQFELYFLSICEIRDTRYEGTEVPSERERWERYS